MFCCAICGITPVFIICQMFPGLEFVLQQPGYSNDLRIRSSHRQCTCKQPLCYQGAGQALQTLHVQVWDGGGVMNPPLRRACEHGALLPVRNKGFHPAWGAHVRATFTPEARGLRIPAGGCVCLLGVVSAVPLCKGNRLLVFSPLALQTQLCCGRFNTYLMRTMCVHTYGCVYICLHIHTI